VDLWNRLWTEIRHCESACVKMSSQMLSSLLLGLCLGEKSSSVCRRVRELHFVDIVDVEQLLDVMGQDVPQVAERVQGLLLPSYFPGACTHSLRV